MLIQLNKKINIMVYHYKTFLENSIIDNPVKYSVIKGGKWEKYMLKGM